MVSLPHADSSRNPAFDLDDPAGKLAPCGHGAFGTCCCSCQHLAQTQDKCGKNEDGSHKCASVGGFACPGLYHLGKGPVLINHGQHGMCELYSSKEEKDAKDSKDSIID